MTKARDDLPVEYLRSALAYDPDTGSLTWKERPDMAVQWNAKFAGREAGTVNDRGYVVVAIYQRDYRAHRIAWALTTGAWPDGEIDHANLVKSDNRWSNLRVSTHAQNNQNKPQQANNTSGYKGVSYCRMTASWIARMKIGAKYVVLGRAADPEQAHALYRSAANEHRGKFSNVGSKG
jgi:hypothetical protein